MSMVLQLQGREGALQVVRMHLGLAADPTDTIALIAVDESSRVLGVLRTDLAAYTADPIGGAAEAMTLGRYVSRAIMVTYGTAGPLRALTDALALAGVTILARFDVTDTPEDS